MMHLHVDLHAAELQAAKAIQDLGKAIHQGENREQAHRGELLQCQKHIQALQKKCACAPGILARAIARAEEKGRWNASQAVQRRIHCKGIYSAEMHALMWQLVKSSCAPTMVGKVMQAVARFGGLNIRCNVSW